jgi:hypothetical protein
MSAQQQEREALQQHDQAGATKRQPKGKAKAEPKKVAKPSLTATAKKHLEELAERIAAADKAKDERLAILKKESERGVPTAELAAAARLSIPRTRQLLSK